MGEISLRKADRVQKLIAEALKRLDVQTTMDLDIHQDDPLGLVAKQHADALKQIQTKIRLIALVAVIRERIAAENARCGIAGLLARKGALERQKEVWESIARATAIEEAALQRKLERARTQYAAATHQYAARDEISVAVLRQEDLDRAATEALACQRGLDRLSEELLEKNAGNRIRLAAEERALLEEVGVL